MEVIGIGRNHETRPRLTFIAIEVQMRAGRWFRWFSIPLLVLTLGAADCSLAADPEASLDAARARWERIGPVDYSITISRSCECLTEMAEPAVVVVRNGAVESRTHMRTGLPVPAEYTQGYPSVDGLFDRIAAGLEAGGESALSVDYHPIFGYPTRFVLGDQAVDAPVTFARDLTAL